MGLSQKNTTRANPRKKEVNERVGREVRWFGAAISYLWAYYTLSICS
jgi:hypothetical protein